MRFKKGQLKSNGKLRAPEQFDFVTSDVIARRLEKDGTDMSLTIGLTFRNPRTMDKLIRHDDALEWLRENGKKYTFEAWYTGDDDLLHVSALSGSDLF